VAGDEGCPDPDRREQRFQELYRSHYRAVLAYAVNRLGPGDDAEEVVADVFTTAWRRLPVIPPPPSDRLWLYGTARRVIARRYRSAGRRHRMLGRLAAEQHVGGQASGDCDPGQQRVLAALARLKPAEREALLLVYWEELSYAEAAQVLGCSANAVGIRVHRARARLRAHLCPAAEGAMSVAAIIEPQGVRNGL
jgi:RNA polymerase sigma factor (sigma-70 family)